jgi:N utilization substance protein A
MPAEAEALTELLLAGEIIEAIAPLEPEIPLEPATAEEELVTAGTEVPEPESIEAGVEAGVIEVPAEEPVLVAQATEPELVEEDAASDFDKIFSLQPEVLDMVVPLSDDETEEDDVEGKKKKKKKKKFVQMEYDPDKDVVVYKKKSKRQDTEGWEGDW